MSSLPTGAPWSFLCHCVRSVADHLTYMEVPMYKDMLEC